MFPEFAITFEEDYFPEENIRDLFWSFINENDLQDSYIDAYDYMTYCRENWGKQKPGKLVTNAIKKAIRVRLQELSECIQNSYTQSRVDKIDAVKITPEQTSLWGNSLSNETKLKVTLKLTYGCEGSARDYFHGGSCWFTSTYATSRDFLESNGGGSLRAYENDRLIGRVWFLPYLNGIILFNAYGEKELGRIETWSNLLKRAFADQNIQKVNMRIETYGAYIFVNSESTNIYIGSDVIKTRQVDIELVQPRVFKYAEVTICPHCNSITQEWLTMYDETPICFHCYRNSGYYRVRSTDRVYPLSMLVRVYHNENEEDFTYNYPVDNDSIVYFAEEDKYYDSSVVKTDVYGNLHLTFKNTSFLCRISKKVYPTRDLVWTIEEGPIAREFFSRIHHTQGKPVKPESIPTNPFNFNRENRQLLREYNSKITLYPSPLFSSLWR